MFIVFDQNYGRHFKSSTNIPQLDNHLLPCLANITNFFFFLFSNCFRTKMAASTTSATQPRNFKVQKLPDDQLAYTDLVYLHPSDFATFQQLGNEFGVFLLVKNKVYSAA